MTKQVNIIELASKLADKDLKDIIAIRWVRKNGNEEYTEKAQEMFNLLYDRYYSVIEECCL